MAKLSAILRNDKRKQLVEKYASVRRESKAILKSTHATEEQKVEARKRLQALPRNASPVRVRNRCAISGRVRGYLRRFNMSRIDFRLLALRGEIPGVRKSSW
jgi:small subunit ribosomal protein S14